MFNVAGILEVDEEHRSSLVFEIKTTDSCGRESRVKEFLVNPVQSEKGNWS